MVLSQAAVAIVGLGLMGGSLGKALVKTGASRQVRALVRRPHMARAVVASEAAHVAGTEPRFVLADADVVVFATPVRTIERQIRELQGFFKAGAVVTDMGSVKGPIAEIMEQLPPGISAVGGHPMCGKEISGLEASDANLFLGKTWVVVPLKNSDSQAMTLVNQLLDAVGAQPLIMSAEDHDENVACVSHLPYLLASTLVSITEEAGQEQPGVWDLASSGFRDTSRVAAGDLTMMLDILDANRENIIRMLGSTRRHIDTLTELLANHDEDGLRRILADARRRRAGMFQNCSLTHTGMVSHG
jgi:prephenate dehydrogenase